MLLICVAIVCLPMLFGLGTSIWINYKNIDKSVNLWECYLLGLIGCMGMFEIAHLAGVFLEIELSGCGTIVCIGLGAIAIVSAICVVVKRPVPAGIKLKKQNGIWIPGILFLLLMGMQIYYVLSVPMAFTSGDIMQETVCSFLSENKIYGVSPLTGNVYGGAPLRYKILCLPTVYALLSRWGGVTPDIILDQMIPVLVICFAYMAYYLLSGSLLGEDADDAEKRLWFMVIVAAIFFLCEKNVCAEGYGILHASHMGTTMRNSVFVPLVLYAALKRKWVLVIGCVLAEACICWTFWGFGVCVVVAAGVFVVAKAQKLLSVWCDKEGRR